jgi:hypothetical protein
MRPATYITYRELFDRVPTQGEVDETFKGLHAFNTVLLAARLNTMFWHSVTGQDPKEMDSFQYWFAKNFLDLDTRERLLARFGSQNASRRPVCHPLQLLNVIRLALALSEGEENARPDTSEAHRHRLGTACLMISDLFLTAEEQANLVQGSRDDRRKQFMLQMLASLEVSNPTKIRNLLFRSYATYRVVLRDCGLLARIRNECGGLDIEKDFERVVGISLMGWLSLVFGIHALLLSYTQQDFISKPETFLFNRQTILQKPTLTPAQVNNFFDALSKSFDELRQAIHSARPVDERLDIVPFKATPLFKTAEDNYACLDYSLFTEKMHNGPYFVLSNRLPQSDRWRVHNAWGLVFEAYVNWLLRSLNGRHSALFFPDTYWEDGSKSFDAVFVKQRFFVAMEYKGGFLRQDARYANDLTAFLDDLERKIAKGCTQLARNIARLFPENRPSKRLLDVPIPANTALVLPVLVVQDLILRTPFVNYFLNERFQADRRHFPSRPSTEVLPLNVVQITHLESFVEMAEVFDLDVMAKLHLRCQIDPMMEGELQDFISQLPEAKQMRCSQRFDEIMKKSQNEMEEILFGEDSVLLQ